MRLMYRVLSVLLLVSGAVLGVWFYLENLTPVPVVMFGKSIEAFPLALWLLAFFVAGTVLGLTLSGFQALRHQMHLQMLRRQLKAMKQKSVSVVQGKTL
jgi:uncharacterized integral membrane protein